MARIRVFAEWDDQRLSLAIMRGKGKRATVERQRLPCAASGEGVAKALGEALPGVSRKRVDLVLAINDRRLVSGAVPTTVDIGAAILDDAKKNGVLGQPEELVVGYCKVGEVVRYCVAPRPLVHELDQALAAAGFVRRQVTSADAVFASLGTTAGETIGVLELLEGRGTLILAQDGAVVASRRLRLPGRAGTKPWEDSDLTLLLGTELQRSLQFFKQQGKNAPSRIIVTGNLEGAPALVITSMTMMLSLAAYVPEAAQLERFADEELPLSWTVPARLTLVDVSQLPSVIEPKRMSRQQKLLAGGSQLAAAACLAGGAWLLVEATSQRSRELTERVAAAQRLQTELQGRASQLDADRRLPAIVEQRMLILTNRSTDPSVSDHFASLAASLPQEARLQELSLDEAQRLEFHGVLEAATDRTAVEVFADVDRALRELPGVTASGGKLQPPDNGGVVRFSSWASPQEAGK